IASLMYLLQEREIKKKRFGYFFRKLPPLHSLERIAEKALYNGFLLLTLGIISGAIWSELAFGSYWRWSAKETITLSLWLIYAGMIHQRILIGWRGKRLAYMFLLGGLLWFFTFFIINFYFKGFHTYGSSL
ncbi:MAG: cytochrome c biogenesis protein CcsA, partial [Caldimicrobium sp.]